MIVWIHSPFDNLPEEGYRKQRYRLLAEAFARSGASVRYWTSDFNHGTKAKRRMIDAIPENGITHHLIETEPYTQNVSFARVRSHRLYARRLAQTMRELLAAHPDAAPDLIVSATPTLGASAALLTLAREIGARFVLDIQDAWPETFARILPRGLRFFAPLVFAPLYRTARRLYREADAVRGVSTRYAAICRRSDYRVFYHGIEREDETERTTTRGRTKLVYLGNLGEGYDLETVLRAMTRRADLTLDIAGKGPREESLRRLSAELALSDRVRFHGYLGRDAARKLMSETHVGIIPMRDDSWVGLPYKLADYLSAGLYVVSSLHGECGELLERENSGRVYDFASCESFLEALDGLDPAVSVHLPDALEARQIYDAYLQSLV